MPLEDILNHLRLSGIFGNDPANAPISSDSPRADVSGVSNAVDSRPYTPNDPNDIPSMMSKLFTPEHRYSDMYDQTLNDMPVREKPSILGRIAGGLLGGAGQFEQAEKAKYPQYYRDMPAWKERIAAIQPGMTNERAGNTNERIVANQTVSSMLRDKDIDRKAEVDRSRQQLEAQKMELKRLHESKPDVAWMTDGTGHIIGLDKHDQTGTPIKTGLMSKDLTELEKYAIQLDNSLQLEQERQKGRMAVAAVPRTVNTNTSTTESGPSTLPPTQEKVRQYNNAQEAYNSHPEWRKWIKLHDPGTNEFEVAKEGDPQAWVFGKGPDAATIAAINKFIIEGRPANSSIKPPAPPARTKTTNRTSTSSKGGSTTPAPAPAASGKVRVKAPDGRTGIWDLSKGPIPKGFEEIK